MCPSWDSALIRSIRLEKLPVSPNTNPVIADNHLIWPCWQLFTFCLKAARFLFFFLLSLWSEGTLAFYCSRARNLFWEFLPYIYSYLDAPSSVLSFTKRTAFPPVRIRWGSQLGTRNIWNWVNMACVTVTVSWDEHSKVLPDMQCWNEFLILNLPFP